jgi:thiamine biosynthesis lipoprotein
MVLKIEFRAMGSDIMAALDTSEENSGVLERVPGWFDRWEDSLSRFRPGSELNRVNAACGKPVRVSRTFWEVLQLSLRGAAESEAIVTPEVLDSMEAIGYDRSFDLFASERIALREFNPRGSRLDEIQLDPSTRTVILPAGLRLDFGGFGKGWAAHQAMARLRKYGPALVNAGGDIAASGPLNDQTPWPVGVEAPFERGMAKQVLAIQKNGLATSGRDHRRWMAGGAWQHHIIDPRSGRSAVTDILIATILAPTVMEAELAAKTVFIKGSRNGETWLMEHPRFSGMIILESGESRFFNNFSDFFWRES